MSHVAVAGAGLTGSLLAVRLARAGHQVDLYDRRPDLRIRDVDAGRSINLALSTRGLDALARIDLDGLVLAQAIAMPGRMLHDEAGHTTFQPYGTAADHVLHSVNRDALNAALLDAADATPGVTTHFEHRIHDVNPRRGTVSIEHEGRETERAADVVFGCDGAYSAVRGRLQRIGRTDFSQAFLEHGYKELTIAPGPDGTHVFEANALHIWPRNSHMLIALPNPDGSFTATLFWPFEGPVSFAADGATAEQVFGAAFPDALAVIPDVAEQYTRNPASSLVTMRVGPWHHEGALLVLGDAAHAVVPFYGQGANAALEDVTLLMDLYEEHGRDEHATVFAELSRTRKPHADALADLAIEHYEEMRSAVTSRWFLTGKALERAVARVAPQRYLPLYTMVSFTRIPYAEAVARDRRQRERIADIAKTLAVLIVALVIAAVLLIVS